ncbi:hypothetical protein NDU88_002989 [Pleurodeles waltl]|uniref:Uncharacterized protein n=1 Tax=Pleurodeles waltl TaxID=8319 RepID=A0AAV7WRH6_PLEWA|nr:hypothetical protein NDU88_002989 [Pleurodeles waltl]
MSLTSPGPPRKCTAGSGSPGAFVSRPHRNLVSLRIGPGLEAQGRRLQRPPPSGRVSRRAPHLGFGRAPQSRPPS